MSISGGPDIIENGLVLYLDAADNSSYISGSSTWYDISGNSNNGTLTNGPTFNSNNKGAIVFDGVDDYTLVSNGMNSLAGTNTVTFSAWIYRTSAQNYWAGVISNKVNVAEGICLLVDPNSKIFWQYDGGVSGVYAIYGGAALSTNIWYNIVGVYDSVGLKTYLNGALNDSASDAGKSISSSGNMDIFVGSQNGPSNYFPGRISNVQIYNRALSSNEILQNYNSIKGRYNL